MLKKTQFLDYHPEAPRLPPRQKLPPKNAKIHRPRQNVEVKQNEVIPFDWQINWIHSYDELRKQTNDRIEKEKQLNHEKDEAIKKLKDEMTAEKEKLFEKNKRIKKKLEKREQKIRELKSKMKQIEKTEVEKSEAVVDTRYQIVVSKDYVRNIHPYARVDMDMTATKSHKMYKCKVCPFTATKKSSLDVHEEVHQEVTKDIECPVCHKLFNYRRLRLHYNYFIAQLKKPKDEQHKPTGAHAKYDLDYHKDLKKKHKQLKRK